MEELSKEKGLPSSRDKKAAKAENVRGEREQREAITSDHSRPWSTEARETTSAGEGVAELQEGSDDLATKMKKKRLYSNMKLSALLARTGCQQ